MLPAVENPAQFCRMNYASGYDSTSRACPYALIMDPYVGADKSWNPPLLLCCRAHFDNRSKRPVRMHASATDAKRTSSTEASMELMRSITRARSVELLFVQVFNRMEQVTALGASFTLTISSTKRHAARESPG